MDIKILPLYIINQISAGEVVERPASVVKELLENSIDANSTSIKIDIEHGGAKLIRICDNGCGINKKNLPLALTSHATSKISKIEDMEKINTLGFRGEALSSICSVSRLTLSSRTLKQSEGWKIYVEGGEKSFTINPVAHKVGTIVEVLDIFYNTPVRRKFMRSEKTEFFKIHEMVKNIALARFEVSITIHHNGKLVKKYYAEPKEKQYMRRLSSICGNKFVNDAWNISWKHGDLSIRGWISNPEKIGDKREIQYSYVNGRMIRNTIIHRAISKAYKDKKPAYVIYIEVNPHMIDVNVHPTKREVRFHYSRFVHDFIYQAVTSVLHKKKIDSNNPTIPFFLPKPKITAGKNYFSQPLSTSTKEYRESAVSFSPPDSYGEEKKEGNIYKNSVLYNKKKIITQKNIPFQHSSLFFSELFSIKKNSILAGYKHSLGKVWMVYSFYYAIIEKGDILVFMNLPVAENWLRKKKLYSNIPEEVVMLLQSQPLRIPIKFVFEKKKISAFLKHQKILLKIGIELFIDYSSVTLRSVPFLLKKQNLENIINKLVDYLVSKKEKTIITLRRWLAKNLSNEYKKWSLSKVIPFLTEWEKNCPILIQDLPKNLVQIISLKKIIDGFTEEYDENALP